MTRCKNCNKDVNCTCLCGFCMECNEKYGHDVLSEGVTKKKVEINWEELTKKVDAEIARDTQLFVLENNL